MMETDSTICPRCKSDAEKQLNKAMAALREIRYRFFSGAVPTDTGWEESGTINRVDFDIFEKVVEEIEVKL